MKTINLPVLAALVLTGCATPFQAPPDVARIRLERVDSPALRVEKIWLERKRGPLTLKGFVLKRNGAADSTHTHLDVTLYGADQRVLRTSVERFTPQNLQRRLNRPVAGAYQVSLDPLPPDTTRIEVRAHEGDHS